MLNAGADIEARDLDLSTPLHWACLTADPHQVRPLLLHNADCGARNRMGQTPLPYAPNPLFHDRRVDVLARLIAKGADAQSADFSGVTPLHLAAKYGELQVVGTLLRYGANPEAVDKDGKTAMHYAAEHASVIKEDEEGYSNYMITWLRISNAQRNGVNEKRLAFKHQTLTVPDHPHRSILG